MRNFTYDQVLAAAKKAALLRAKYIYTQRDENIMTQLNILLATREQNAIAVKPDSKMGLLVTGDSGAGKSTLLDRHLRDHAALTPDDATHAPLVSLGIQSPITLKSLGLQTLRALGYHQQRENSKANYWADVRNQLELRRVKVLHFDEAQEVFEASSESDMRGILEMLKGLMGNPNWPTIVILSGMPVLERFMERNYQTLRRFYKAPLLPISESGGIAALSKQLAAYAQLANLQLVEDDELVLRLAHAANDQLGLAMEMIVDAIQEVFMADSTKLERFNFADAYERHTGCSPALNIFVSDQWTELRSLRVADRGIPDIPRPKRRSRARGDTQW